MVEQSGQAPRGTLGTMVRRRCGRLTGAESKCEPKHLKRSLAKGFRVFPKTPESHSPGQAWPRFDGVALC